jgi:hypothetical protein
VSGAADAGLRLPVATTRRPDKTLPVACPALLPNRLLKNYLRGDRSVKNRLNSVICCPSPVLALRSLPRIRFSAAC